MKKNIHSISFLLAKALSIIVMALSLSILLSDRASAQITIFSEDWSSSSFTTNGWTFDPSQPNWNMGSSYTPTGASSPNAYFSWSPEATNYSVSLISPVIASSAYISLTLDYKLLLDYYSTSTLEQFKIEYKAVSDADWTLLMNYDNTDGSFNVNSTNNYLTGTDESDIQLRFTAYGEDSYDINGWGLDDIIVKGVPAVACNGTPDGGTTVSSESSICTGDNFTLSLSGATIAGGMTYQWYSSPAGADNYTEITGANAPAYTVTDQTASTDYYCELTCNNSGVSANSDPVSIGQNPPNQCYCTPSFEEEYMYVSNVEFAGITNETDGWAANGYGDYTSQTANVIPTLPSTLSIDLYAWYEDFNLYAYVDWNQNGVLDDPGEVYTIAADDYGGDMSYSLDITPPVDAVPGNTRMRIALVNYYDDDGSLPCADDIYLGEAEDYTVNVATLDPCAGTPETGTLSGPASVCADIPFTLSLSDFTIASGMVYEWQQSPAGAGTWADISGASGVVYNNPGITDATDYRVIFTCTASGESDTSNVLSISMNGPLECYCTPTSTSSSYYINDFSTTNGIANISNLSSGMSGNGYGDFTNDTVSVIQSQSFDFSGDCGPYDYYTYGAKAWIDWGLDGAFDPGDQVFNTAQYNNAFSGTITVPATTAPGNYRMRIRIDEYTSTGPEDPCENESEGEGEAEDYILKVIPMPPCADATFPDMVGTLAFPTSLCVSGDVHLNLASPMPVASGITYQWQYATSETGTYTNIGTASATPANIYNTNTTYWYRCQVKCDGTLILTSTPVEVEAVVPEDPVMTDGQHCGPGTVTLSGTVGSGNLYWYPDETSFTPIASGDTFITPALNSDVTYYVSAGASPTIDTVVGTGTSTGSSYEADPFYIGYGVGWKHQYLIKASELLAAGFTPGSTISRIGVFVTSTSPTGIFDNFSIATGTITQNSLSSFADGLTPQYSDPAYAPTNGPNMFNLSSPITWDGTSNIVVQMCFYDENTEAATVNVKYGNVPGTCIYGYSYDGDACDDWEYGPYSTSSRPNFYFTQQGCESDRVPVTAYIRDTPVVDLGPDEDICGDANQSVTLDAGNPGSTYVWDDGSTGQTLTMSHSGTHYVTVTNEYGCVSSDTTTKGILLAPEVHLGNDTTICNGVTIILNAGDDGIIYYWNTGDTVSTIDVNSTGTYSVVVTNDLDCTVSDTINVNVEGDLPTIDAILVTNVGPYSFKFEAYNPQGAITGYTWDFGDDQAVSHEVSPTHTYQGAGDYQVTLTLNTATCGLLTFTTSTHIVGVNDISVDDAVLGLYPNPARDMITIENKGSFRMEELVITNAVGQVMARQTIENGVKKQQLSLSGYANGIYSVRIKTDKGYVVRRFEVLK